MNQKDHFKDNKTYICFAEGCGWDEWSDSCDRISDYSSVYKNSGG